MRTPFYRSGKFLIAGTALVVATAAALFFAFDGKNSNPATKSFISPPLAHINIPDSIYRVDAEADAVLDYKTGSQIHIPADAFRDADGKPVKGKVDLHYREFHDQRDIFISGIPMTYDSAGTKYVFESAGMMEITASQNGKALCVNPNKPIKVDMVSNTRDDKYKTYYLDTATKKWVVMEQATLQPAIKPQIRDSAASELDAIVPALKSPEIAQCEQQVTKAQAAVKECEKEKPAPVVKADVEKIRFHIVVDPEQFPEIAMYKGVCFQVKDENSFDKNSAKTEWENVGLKKLSGLDYQITFSKGEKSYTVLGTPVVEAKDLAAAQKLYDQKFAQYEAKLTERKTAGEKAKHDYEAQYQAALKAQQKEAEKYKQDMQEQNKTNLEIVMAQRAAMGPSFQNVEINEMEQQEAISRAGGSKRDGMKKVDLIFRTFVVSKFGVHNSDCPNYWPANNRVMASLISEKGDKIQLSTIYLVVKGYNIVYPYYAIDGVCGYFQFDSTKENMIWGVTKDNKLAVVDIKSFAEQQGEGNKGKIEFKCRLVDADLKNADEVKKYLQI